MKVFQCNLYFLVAVWTVTIQSISLAAEQIPVRRIEGMAFGLLVLPYSSIACVNSAIIG